MGPTFISLTTSASGILTYGIFILTLLTDKPSICKVLRRHDYFHFHKLWLLRHWPVLQQVDNFIALTTFEDVILSRFTSPNCLLNKKIYIRI